MIRRVLSFMLVLVGALVLVNTVNTADLAERIQRNDALSGYTPVHVCNAEESVDPSLFWKSLKRSADEAGINLFRKVSGWTPADQPFSSYYAYFSQDNTSFFESFSIVGMNPRNVSLTSSDWSFGTSNAEPLHHSSGTISDIAANDQCLIVPLEKAFDSYPIIGIYYVEAPVENRAEEFVSLANKYLQQADISATLAFSSTNQEATDLSYDAGEVDEGLTNFAVLLSVLIVVAIIGYYQLSEAKRFSILALYGNGIVSTWFQACGKYLFKVIGISLVLYALLVAFIPGSSAGLIVQIGANLAYAFGIILVSSCVIALIVRPRNNALALKGRSSAKKLAMVCLGAKAVLCITLAGMCASTLGMQEALQEEAARYKSWSQASQYGIFSPLSLGYDGNELETKVIPNIVFDFYPTATKKGALYIDSSQYLPIALANSSQEYRSITVNPNYLKAFPIVDCQGNIVNIQEAEQNWILLVPEAYRAEEQSIREKWDLMRNPDEEGLTLWDKDVVWCGRTVESVPSDQAIEIIWVKNNQQIFGFNPEIGKENDGNISDPIIEVLTLSNSCGMERWNAITGGMESALKIPLAEGDPVRSYEEYRPLLSEYGLDDNLKQLVTHEGAVFEALQGFRDARNGLILQMSLVLVAFIIISVQCATLLFEMNLRLAAVKKVFGYGFFSREARPIIVWGSLWIATVTGMGLLQWTTSWPTDVMQIGATNLFNAVACLLIIDTCVTFMALYLSDRRRSIDVLKGNH